MAKKPTPTMADIEIDAGVVRIPPAQGRTKPYMIRDDKPPMEKFQVFIPLEIAMEIRVEAAKRGMSYSALVLEAWELWKKNPPESY